MKTYIANIIAAMILVACSGNKTSEATEPIADKGQSADTVEIKANADSASVDGVSSATNVANSPTFNGVMMVSPQQNATLSLTMGGKVHSLKVMPGQAVSRGQVVATIDNPEYIELQQTYLDASAQTEFLERNTSAKRPSELMMPHLRKRCSRARLNIYQCIVVLRLPHLA